jgi:asparagine synthase (glutamine-hydrolysing)
MCGLAGFLTPAPLPEPLTAVARRMGAALAHRGPDDAGEWVDESAGFALAHRRLSILDLSPAGHQPMQSPSGRYVIAFNGEIYNHLELRTALEKTGAAPSWRGHADTETLLAAVDAWGVAATLERLVGMYGWALWDRRDRVLYLARDRLGEKPLYYGWVCGALVFGSELKALRAFPGFSSAIDRRALALFMRHNYVPAPWSIYQQIWKLAPGSFVRLEAGRLPIGERGDVTTYWRLRDAAIAGQQQPFEGSEEEALDGLQSVLSQALRGQMVADVPLGAFLSGGVDSSTVVALMQSVASQPVRTFTIGFEEAEYNEAHHAEAVARHLDTAHTALYVTPRETLDVIPRLPSLYDEPFADSSQVPTFLVSQLARRHVTVALSGDGGDELFGGYNRYFWALRLWRRLALLPQPVRHRLARILQAVPPGAWNRVYGWVAPALPARWRVRLPGDKAAKLAELLQVERGDDLYVPLVSHWMRPATLVLGADEPRTAVTDPAQWLDTPDFAHRMMYLDAITYLPDDILVKVDRAAMGVSLETRVPLLDHRVVEFAWRLPLRMKVHRGEGKRLLRKLLYRYVPAALIERPKMGFGVPIDQWLRGPLRDWAEDLLSESRLRREGYLDPAPIRALWAAHLSGTRNAQYLLWDVLMFQAWYAHWQAAA